MRQVLQHTIPYLILFTVQPILLSPETPLAASAKIWDSIAEETDHVYFKRTPLMAPGEAPDQSNIEQCATG